jgi:hypothetical protein
LNILNIPLFHQKTRRLLKMALQILLKKRDRFTGRVEAEDKICHSPGKAFSAVQGLISQTGAPP